jgi:hypothetical protein
MARNNSNQLVVPGVQQALDQMKYEIFIPHVRCRKTPTSRPELI